MWDEQMSSRMRHLQQRQQDGTLTAEEQSELTLLIRELEAAEAGYLTTATQRLHQERETLENQNRTLEGLALRKETLVRRLREFLTEARSEQRTIERGT